METRVQYRMTSCEIVDRQNGIASGFCRSFFGFTLLIIISLLLHAHLSPLFEVHDSLYQAARCHILSVKFGNLSLTQDLPGYGIKYFIPIMQLKTKQLSIVDAISACGQRMSTKR
jgi:hypothetical protein